MSRRRRRGSPSMDLSDANAEKPSLAAILNNAIGEMTNPLRPIAPMNRLNFPGGQGIMNNRGSNEIIRNAISSLMNNDNNRHPPVQHDSYHPHEGGPPHRPPFVDSQNIRPHNEPPGMENPGMGPPKRMSNPINPVQNNVPPQGMPPYSQGPFMNPPASMQQNQAQIQPMVPPIPFQSMGPMPMVPTFPPPMMPIQFVPIPYPTVPKKKSAKKTPKSSNEEFADLLKKRSSQTAEVDVKVDDIAGTKTEKIKTKSKGKSTVSNNETTPTSYSDTVVIPKFRYNMHKQLKEIKSLALRKAAAAAVAAAATSAASSSTSSKAATSNATVTTATTKTEVSILPVRTTTKTISTIKIIKPTFKALQMQPVDINTESKTSTETPKKYSRSRSRTRSPRSRRRSHSRSRRRSHSRSRRRSRSRSRHSYSRSRRSHSRSRRRTRSRSSSHRHDYRRGRDRKRDGHDDSIFKEIYGSNYSTKEKKRSPSPPPKIKTSSPNVPRRSRSRSNSASFDRKKGWKNSSKSPENKKENDTVGSQDTKHEEISDRSKHVSKKDVTEPPKERVRRRRSRSISRERRPLKRDRVDDRYRNERPVRSFSPKRRSISPVRRSVSPVSKRNMERRYPLIDDLSSRSPEQRERLVHDGPILRDPAIVARLERERSKMPPMHDPIPSRPIDPYRPREHYDTPYRDPYFESRGRVSYMGDRHLLPPIERYRDPRLYERPLEYRDDYRPPATSAYDPAYDRRLPPRDYLPPTREYREGLYERNPIPRDVPYEEKRYDEERMPPSSSRHDLHDNSRLSWRSRMSHGDSTLDDFAAPINRPEDDINYKQESSERVNSFGDDVKNIEFNSYDRPPSTHSSVQQREISSTNSELAEHSEQYMQPENQPEMLPDEDRRDDYEPLYTSGEVTQGGHRNENHFQSSNVQKNSYGDDGQNNLRDLLGINAVQLKGYLKEFGVE